MVDIAVLKNLIITHQYSLDEVKRRTNSVSISIERTLDKTQEMMDKIDRELGVLAEKGYSDE